MGDIGGLGGALFALGNLILTLINYGQFDTMMISALFR